MHISMKLKKVMGVLLYLNLNKFEATTLKTVVELLAISTINYCLPVYGTTNSTLMRRLQKLQNLPLRFVLMERGGATTPNPLSLN